MTDPAPAEEIAEILSALQESDPGRVAALSARLLDALDRRDAEASAELEQFSNTVVHTFHSVHALGEAASSTELVERTCDTIINVCGATRVLVSRLRGNQAVPVLCFSSTATGALTLPPPVEIEPSSPEQEAIDSGVPIRIPRSGAGDSTAVAAVFVGGTAVALLQISGLADQERLDLVGLCVAALGASLERLDLKRRHAQQLEVIRDTARTLTEANIPEPIPATGVSAPDRRGPAREAPKLLEPLSKRERDVLQLILAGASNAAIATELVITVDTVKSHVKSVLRKCGAANRRELIARHTDRA